MDDHASVVPLSLAKTRVLVTGGTSGLGLALVDEFRAVRAASLAFFVDLPEEAWDRRGIASDNPFSVRALAYIAAGHVAHHAAILRERYLSHG